MSGVTDAVPPPVIPERALPPASAADVQHAVREAARRGGALRIAGAGTWLSAKRPVASGETLSLRGLRGVVEYVPGDLTITAMAGTTLEELDHATAEHGQWLALDPPGTRSGTLGATIATASSGPLAASFGTPRDVVLGIECVTGDGDVIRGGARVVKHVAGFDLVRLATGAWGTLGIVTMATLRLRARAPIDATFAVPLPPGPIGPWIAAYRGASIAPLAAELVNAEIAFRLGIGPDAVALVRVSGNEEAVAAQEGALRELGAPRRVAPDIWSALAAADPATPSTALRLSQRPARLADIWEDALRFSHGLPGARIQATIDRGVVRVVLPEIAEGDLQARLRSPNLARWGRVFEVLPARLWPPVAAPSADDALTQRIRAAFDPDRRLNPGILGET